MTGDMTYTLENDRELREQISAGRLSEYEVRILAASAMYLAQQLTGKDQITALHFSVDGFQWADNRKGRGVQAEIPGTEKNVELFPA